MRAAGLLILMLSAAPIGAQRPPVASPSEPSPPTMAATLGPSTTPADDPLPPQVRPPVRIWHSTETPMLTQAPDLSGSASFEDSSCCGLPLCPLPQRWTLRHDVGDGVGFERGFTYLEAFLPLWQPVADELLFSVLRVVNFDDADRWEFNAGVGYRALAPRGDAVLGLNCFYDGRHTDTNFFHQIGVGGEAIFERCELRCNGYIIVGPDAKLADETGFGAFTFGDRLIIARLLTHDVAMGGVDVEAGFMAPALGRIAPRFFVGGYHYSAERMPSVNGIRGRLEAWLSRNVTLHAAIQHDQVFDTTVSGGVAVHLGGGDVARNRRHDSPRSVEERLVQRVVRDVNIVVTQQETLQGLISTIPSAPNTKNAPPPPSSGSGGSPGNGGGCFPNLPRCWSPGWRCGPPRIIIWPRWQGAEDDDCWDDD